MTAERPLVLVVDDDATQRLLLEAQVARLGWPVLAVGGGDEALAAVDDTFVGLVLLDRWMPDVDGVEVTRRLRAREVGGDAHLPIVELCATLGFLGLFTIVFG